MKKKNKKWKKYSSLHSHTSCLISWCGAAIKVTRLLEEKRKRKRKKLKQRKE
jgi:hypothetical protein